MKFEWDQEKRRSNLRKHGLDFTDAPLAFTEDAIIIADENKDDEDRYILIGTVYRRIVTIVFTDRDEVTRIISMRDANKREQKEYVKNRLNNY